MIEIKERVKIPGEVEPVIEYETRLHTLSNGHCRPKIAVDRLDVRVLLSTLGWERDRAATRELEIQGLERELQSYTGLLEAVGLEVGSLRRIIDGQNGILDELVEAISVMRHDEEQALKTSKKKNFARLEMMEEVFKKLDGIISR